MKRIFISILAFLLGLTSCSQSPQHQIRIAILTPVTHPSLEQIQKGFIETLMGDDPKRYHFDIFNAQGNKTLMRSEIEEIIQQNYNLVCTLGALSSQMAVEIFTRKGIQIPIVFTCVNDPLSFHIIRSEASSGNMATGVKELIHLDQELSHLLYYKPDIQTLLLVYNPTEPGLEKDRKQLQILTHKLNIELLIVEVFQTSEILAKTTPFMDKVDAVLTLKDNSVVSGLDALVKLCNKHQVPLMASDLDSPDKGAAFGFGVPEIEFGREAGKKALLILKESKRPTDIPVTPVSGFTLRINKEAAKQQGVDHDRLDF